MAAVLVVPRRSALDPSGAGLGTDIRTGGAEALLDNARLDGDLFGDSFLGVGRFGGSKGFGVEGLTGAIFAAGAVVVVVRPCNMPKLEVPGNGMPRVLHILFK